MTDTRTALIVVDMQNAFITPSQGTGVTAAAEVLKKVNRHVASAAAADRPIFYTRDIDPTGRAAASAGYDEALHPDLDVSGTIVDKGPGSKGGFSGFVLASTAVEGGTAGGGGLSSLAGLLLQARVNEVTVVGIATDVCVASTAVDAIRLGYTATVDLDATAFVHAHPDGDAAAVSDLQGAGVRIVGSSHRHKDHHPAAE